MSQIDDRRAHSRHPPRQPYPTAPPFEQTREAEMAERVERLARRRRPAAQPPAGSSGGRPRGGRPNVGRPNVGRPAGGQRAGGQRAGRRRPARRARLAALGISLASSSALTWYFSTSTATVAAGPATVVTQPATPTTVARANSTGSATATSPTTTRAPAPAAANTVVTGSAIPNRYGTVQVRATFDGSGALVSVDALQTPGGQLRSIEISRTAVPLLATQADRAQSARIDGVTGATYTSQGYEDSLQSAIDAARAAGRTSLT